MGETLRIALAQVAVGQRREDNIRKALKMMAHAASGRTYDCSPVFSIYGAYLGEQRTPAESWEDGTRKDGGVGDGRKARADGFEGTVL